MAVTKCAAYLWWMVGGIFGWHYLYVGEPQLALVYAQSLGLFGIGWVLDFFKVPRLVREANAPSTAADIKDGKARFQLGRLAQAYFVAWLYAAATNLLFAWYVEDVRYIDNHAGRYVAYGALCFAAALGAWLIGTIGYQTTSFLLVLLCACAGVAFRDAQQGEWTTVTTVACVSAIAAAFFRRPATDVPLVKPTDKVVHKGVLKPVAQAVADKRKAGCCGRVWRLWKFGAAVGTFYTVAGTGLFLNLELNVDATGKHSDSGIFKEKIGLYLWKQRAEIVHTMKDVYGELHKYYNMRGWEGMKADFFEHVWKENDYTVLGLSEDAPLSDVKSAYRKMARELHPDRLPADLPDKEKQEKVERFRKVHAAYERITGKAGWAGRSSQRRGGSDDESGSSDGDGDGSSSRRRAGRGRRSRRGEEDEL